MSISADGKTAHIVLSRSPDVRSIAVKSRFVSTYQLARLYQLYKASGPRDLENRVQEILQTKVVNVIEKTIDNVRDQLEEYGLLEMDKSLFYNKMFYLETRDVLDEETLSRTSREHWRALGVIAAAHELAVW